MKLGFIGCGNMASAMIGGIIKNQICSPKEITVHDLSAAAMERAKTACGVMTAENNQKVMEESDLVVLAVKPQFYQEVIQEIAPAVKEGQIIVTIAPGKTLAWLAETFGKTLPIVRTMEEWEKVTEYDINVSAAELIFKDVSEPLADRKFLADLGERGIFPWVNAITLNDRDILSGGLDDNGAIGEGFDENWGVLLDMGFKILQTDWPALLRNYVNQKYHL